MAEETEELRLRALERDDLRFVHDLNNNYRVMAYWFEEQVSERARRSVQVGT